MNLELPESRRGSRSRALERSLSYSEAIGNSSRRSSIAIPRLYETDVYVNEELKKHYRISQTYVEGKEIAFASCNITDIPLSNTFSETSQSSEDDQTDGGLVMTIDVESDDKETKERAAPEVAEPVYENTNDIYDRIEAADSIYNEVTFPPSTQYGYPSAIPYSRRKKKGVSHRRRHGRPNRSRRVVLKNGDENVPVRSNIPSKSIKYMRDVVNTVINSKWRFIIVMMIVSHFVFWLFFAGIWYAVSTSYQEDIGDGKTHCVVGTSSFAGLLMMSIETQMTIGYGVRYPNEECPEAIIIMVFEIVAGTALSGGLSSLLFTKLVRPNRHVTSVGFSKKAAVCLRDGYLCLQFRVWDLLNVHLIDSTITAYMLNPIRTLEGETMQNYIQQLKLSEARSFMLWPLTVVHVIDSESPLYHLAAQDIMDFRFEIVVALTGSSKNMGTVTQSRTSYLSKEIIWGYRFKNVLKYSKKDEAYVIDYEHLNTVEQVETPLCSASRLKEFEEDIKSSRHILDSPEMSLSMTNESLNTSLPSSPNLTMTGTQRSIGWNFQRFQPEKYVPVIGKRTEL